MPNGVTTIATRTPLTRQQITGFWGAWAGGWAFILPNFIIVSALGALYVHFSGLPILTAIFYGVSPAVIALILHSCYRLSKLGMEAWLQWAISAACFVVTVTLQAEVAVLFVACGLIGVLYYGSLFRHRATASSATAVVSGAVGIGKVTGFSILGKLLLFFLKAEVVQADRFLDDPIRAPLVAMARGHQVWSAAHRQPSAGAGTETICQGRHTARIGSRRRVTSLPEGDNEFVEKRVRNHRYGDTSACRWDAWPAFTRSRK